MIKDADGYTYATLADRLLGRPEKTTRNGNLSAYYEQARRLGESPGAAKAYAEGFDSVCPEGDPGPSEAFAKAHQEGLVRMFTTRAARANRYTSNPR